MKISNGISLFRTLLSKRSVQALVSVFLVALIFQYVDMNATLQTLLNVNVYFLILGIFMLVVDRLFSGLRWYLLLKHVQPEIRYWEVMRITLVAGFLGFFIPGTMGTEVMRIYAIGGSNVRVSMALSSIFLERFFAILALVFLVFLGPWISDAPLPGFALGVAWSCLAVLAALAVLLFDTRARALTRALLPDVVGRYVNPKLEQLYEALDLYRRAPRLLLGATLYAFVFQVFRSTHIFVLALAVGISVDWTTFLALEPIVRIATMMPVSISGVGVRETGFAVTLGAVGTPASASVALSVLTFLFIVVGNIPGAFLWRRKVPEA